MKVLIIEDELIIGKDIQVLLKTQQNDDSDIALNPKEAIRLFNLHPYDLIISDINLNAAQDGIDTVKTLNGKKKTPVIFLTAYSDSETIERAEGAFPFAYLLKPFNNNQLLLTIKLAIQNFRKMYDPGIQIDSGNTLLIDALTQREKEVLVVLSSGKIAKEIADSLNISHRTVEKHIANIKEKLNLSTSGELIHFAMSSKMLHINGKDS